MGSLGRCIVTLVAFVWLFSAVCFQMCLQIACVIRRIITFVAFVCFFSAVCYQMSPQIICLRTCVITLATFFWLFSAVCFQMSPQIVCPSGRKATLVALVFPLTCFCHSHGSFCFIIVFIWVKMLKILIHHNLQERRRRDNCWTSAPLMFWFVQILTK